MYITPDELKNILDLHARWLWGEEGGVKWVTPRDANLAFANLTGANLAFANLSDANLRSVNLRSANLSGANLYGADLSGANLHGADLSGVKNLLNPAEWMKLHFSSDAGGWIVYKAVGNTPYADRVPAAWRFEPGCMLEEVANPDRETPCGSGVNFGSLDFVKKEYPGCPIWRCRIAWVDACGIVVPFNTGGKARCGRLELIEELQNA